MKTPITLGIDPAAPNGDCSAVAVIQGNRIHQILFNALHSTDPVKLQGTVTGRSSSFNPPIWQLPRHNRGSFDMPTRHNKIYLFRNMQIVYEYSGVSEALGDAHDAGQSGDIALIISYMGKYRMFYWRGKKKHYWRAISTKKKPELLAMLKAALLLQS